MTRMSEVSPIFTFSLTKGSAPSMKSNLAISGKGFLSTSTAMARVPGMLLAISTGTTAPFSAICGASMRMSLLGAAPVAPMPLSASAAVLAPKASLFQAAASAAHGLSTPAASTAISALLKGFIECGAILASRPAEYSGLAPGFLLQPQLGDAHAAIDRFKHVVDREQAHCLGGQRLHFHPGLPAAFDAREDAHRVALLLELEVDGHARDRERMRERHQVGGALGRLDSCDARHPEDVALARASRGEQPQGGALHDDAPGGDGDAVGRRFPADVDHVRGTFAVEMGQRVGQCAVPYPGHAGRYHKHMRLMAFSLVAALALGPRAAAQSLPD